jgi:hypothetical protein
LFELFHKFAFSLCCSKFLGVDGSIPEKSNLEEFKNDLKIFVHL